MPGLPSRCAVRGLIEKLGKGKLMKYYVDNGHCEVEIEADSAKEAAQEYVDNGDYGHDCQTVHIHVYVCEGIDDGYRYGEFSHTITVDPPTPKCEADGEEFDSHDWQAPHSILAGDPKNPGFFGHGRGAIIKHVCAHCGIYRKENTSAQNMDTGEYGLNTVTYFNADKKSIAWIKSN